MSEGTAGAADAGAHRPAADGNVDAAGSPREPEGAGGAGTAGPADLAGLMPFASVLGFAVDAAGPREVRGRLAWAPERCTAGGVMHGGALMAFADSLGGICAYLNLPSGAGTATVSSSTVFTRAVRAGEVTGVAVPLHVGRTTIVVRTGLTDDAGRVVAEVTQVQAVTGRP